MEAEEIQALLIDELKDLRKGAGLSEPGRPGKGSLLWILVTMDKAQLLDVVRAELVNLDDQQRLVLLNAFRINDADSPGEVSDAPELMARRDWYTDRYSVSERTLTRHEDASIDKLARRLTLRLATPEGREAIRNHYDQLSRPNASRKFANALLIDTSSLPDDLPGLIRFQAEASESVAKSLSQISGDLHRTANDLAQVAEKLVLLNRANKRVAKTWNIDLND